MKENQSPIVSYTIPKERIHKGICYVCAHRVSFFYHIPYDSRVNTNVVLISRLNEEAENRAKSQIIEGYVSGELNYEDDNFQATGWWKIEKD